MISPTNVRELVVNDKYTALLYYFSTPSQYPQALYNGFTTRRKYEIAANLPRCRVSDTILSRQHHRVHASLPEPGLLLSPCCFQFIFSHELNFPSILMRFLIQNHQLLVCADQRTSRSNTFICRAAVLLWKKWTTTKNLHKTTDTLQTNW